MIQTRTLSDIEVQYRTGSTFCDASAWALNVVTGKWDQFAFDPPDNFGCDALEGTHSNTLLAQGLRARDYIDPLGILKVADSRAFHLLLSTIGNPVLISAVRWDSRYLPVRLQIRPYDFLIGFASDGAQFWTVIDYPSTLARFSMTGLLIDTIPLPISNISGFAADTAGFWMSDHAGFISRVDNQGHVLCRFRSPSGCEGAMTIAFHKLWLAERDYGSHRIFAIDADSSCKTGYAVVTDSLTGIGFSPAALTTDGVKLFAAACSYFQEFSPDGAPGRSAYLSVGSVSGMHCDGKFIWIMFHGVRVWSRTDRSCQNSNSATIEISIMSQRHAKETSIA